MSFVDVQIAPWVIRLNRVLKPYRGWPVPEPDSRWARWVEAIEMDEHVQATTSTDELYLDSYERYAGEYCPEPGLCIIFGSATVANVNGQRIVRTRPSWLMRSTRAVGCREIIGSTLFRGF